MNKKTQTLIDAIIVTLGGLFALALAFVLYFLIFMVFETLFNNDSSYDFVSSLRVGYGIIWIIICIIIFFTKAPEKLKACVLAGSLGAFMIGIGVQLYRSPVLAGLILFLVCGITVFLLYKMKKEWYHYYAVAISAVAALLYL